MSVQRVEMDTLSPEVRAFLAQANEGNGVLVEDPRSQERYCLLKFHEPTPEEQRTALQKMSQIGAAVQASLEQRQMSGEDAERELQHAIAEVRREKAGV